MKQDFYYFTQSCIDKKDKTADEYQQRMLTFALMNDIEYKSDYKKEMIDVRKILAIKKEILDASLNFDKCVLQFNIQKPRITFRDYDNYSRYVAMICDRYNICNDLKNVILRFAIDKTYYNREIRKMRKHKKNLCINI